ncbi:hypothetical protein PR202_gb09714 [Eleusine coracana subsp. coracana]|uniref:Uncharacterized protein n=1 Tax=Eleusine coracana subsp. coracana TaxID=191504 RepID=A0AAV5EJ23_ELECO|nr:hypothetical protein PR202_gb09714 [Eleusine coracana subsp. coracana]
MGRQPCCEKVGLKKGPWTAEEDQKLVTFLLSHGHCCWRLVPKLAGKQFDCQGSLPMASVANLPPKSYSDMSLRELIDLLKAQLEAKEEAANHAAVLAQPVMVVPAAKEKKVECAAVLVQTPSLLFLAAPSVPINLLERPELQQRVKNFCNSRSPEHWLKNQPPKRVELQKALGNHLSWKDR